MIRGKLFAAVCTPGPEHKTYGGHDLVNLKCDPARGEMTKQRDNYYPVVRAKDLFQIPDGRDNVEEGILIWVEAGEKSYCLFVDELLGEQQIVVKPLPPYVNSFNVKDYGISGCSILGDGSISLILDMANVYNGNVQGAF